MAIRISIFWLCYSPACYGPVWPYAVTARARLRQFFQCQIFALSVGLARDLDLYIGLNTSSQDVARAICLGTPFILCNFRDSRCLHYVLPLQKAELETKISNAGGQYVIASFVPAVLADVVPT